MKRSVEIMKNRTLETVEEIEEIKVLKKKDIRFLPKILIHIIAISCFMIGLVILHVAYNYLYANTWFFGIEVERPFIFDTGLLCITIGFFTEFFLTFRPIYILIKRKKG